jgi:hypothetical protein
MPRSHVCRPTTRSVGGRRLPARAHRAAAHAVGGERAEPRATRGRHRVHAAGRIHAAARDHQGPRYVLARRRGALPAPATGRSPSQAPVTTSRRTPPPRWSPRSEAGDRHSARNGCALHRLPGASTPPAPTTWQTTIRGPWRTRQRTATRTRSPRTCRRPRPRRRDRAR